MGFFCIRCTYRAIAVIGPFAITRISTPSGQVACAIAVAVILLFMLPILRRMTAIATAKDILNSTD